MAKKRGLSEHMSTRMGRQARGPKTVEIVGTDLFSHMKRGTELSQFDLTVIIPTHNRREVLMHTLNALVTQSHPSDRFEVVVVCDGCVDGTYEMLSTLATPFRLRAFAQASSGPAAARNRGVQEAEAPILLFIDDDIIGTPDLIVEHIRMHIGHDDRAVIGRLLPDPNIKLPGWTKWEHRVFDSRYDALERGTLLAEGVHFYTGNVSVAKAVFNAVGGFNVAYRRAEDIELGYRLQKVGAQFVFNSCAAGIHCSDYTFEPWSKIHYNYGRYHVRLANNEGHADVMPVASWFRQRNALNKLLAHIAIGRPALHHLLVSVARAIAFVSDRVGVIRLSHWSYSAITNLCYWQGVADELGGPHQFWNFVQADQRGYPQSRQGVKEQM